MKQYLLSLLFIAFLFSHSKIQAQDSLHLKTFTCFAVDKKYQEEEITAQFRFYSIKENGDSVFTEWRSSEENTFNENLSEKNGIEITALSMKWFIPIPCVRSDDITRIEFRFKNYGNSTNYTMHVSVIPFHQRITYSYSIPGNPDSLEANNLMLILPQDIKADTLKIWRDSTQAMNVKLNSASSFTKNANEPIRIFVFTGNKNHFLPCDSFSIRMYKNYETDTTFSKWIPLKNDGHPIISPFNIAWSGCQVKVNDRIYSGRPPYFSSSEYEKYNLYEFYFDTSSSDSRFGVERYSSKGHSYYSDYSSRPPQRLLVYLSKNCLAEKETDPSFTGHFFTPVFPPPFYFFQAGCGIYPFNRFVGFQFKHETGEEGVFLFDDILGLKYYYGNAGGKEVIAEDASILTNWGIGILRFGIGTSFLEGRDRFGWTFKPLLGVSTGGIDLMMGYDLYLAGNKKFRDTPNLNLTFYIGPFLRKKHRPQFI